MSHARATTGLVAHGLHLARAGRPVLRDAGIVLPPGRVTALVAPSGAGKSTLLRCLVRLVEPDAGEIRLDGRSVTELEATALRRRVGLVAQHPAMLPGTVADNVRHGLPDLADEAVGEALRAAGLTEGFAGRPAAALSGGEQARVGLARALSRRPEILLLDEPTAALDEAAAGRIGTTLRTLAADGIGICLSTHDLALADAVADARATLPGPA
jgi:ABC-type multidrug transport system fused ATPase/permease subunit